MIIILYSLCKDCGCKIKYRSIRCNICSSKFEEESNKINNRNRYTRDKVNADNIRMFYISSDWRNKREDIIKQYDNHCAICRVLGRYTVGSDVHHIVPMSKDFGKRLDNNNLILVCSGCHKYIHRNNIDNESKLEKYINRKISSNKFIKKLLEIENSF